MSKTKQTIIMTEAEGNTPVFIKCRRISRVSLTREMMRLAERPGLALDHTERLVGMLQKQLLLEDWTHDEFDLLDMIRRSTRANSLTQEYELKFWRDIPVEHRRRHSYDALRGGKQGGPLDVVAIMREAAQKERIDFEAFVARHQLDLSQPKPKRIGGGASDALVEKVDDMAQRLEDYRLGVVDVLAPELARLAGEVADMKALLVQVLARLDQGQSNVVQLHPKPKQSPALVDMKARMAERRVAGLDH